MRALATILLAAVLSTAICARAADNGIADKPYMGWSSWSSLRKDFDEGKIVAEADVMADKLKKYGYTYIDLDAGWHNDQDFDENGRRLPDATKFPHGIKWLADYVHSKGLKFGLYVEPGMPIVAYNKNGIIAGTNIHIADITDATQNGNTLRKNFYKIDFTKSGSSEWVDSSAELIASWGVDFIKCDFVGPSTLRSEDTRDDVKHWYAALQKQHPIWFELSNNLRLEDVEFYRQYSNGWRIDNDVEAYRNTKGLTDWPHILRRFKDVPKWAAFAGKGGWNDLDSLELGPGDKTGLTPDERRTAMTLWCISCAPLFLGTDLTQLTDEDLPIITNSEAIAIDQAGEIATPISQDTPQQVWRVKNQDGSYTVALFNLADAKASVGVKWTVLQVAGTASVRDLWQHKDLGNVDTGFSVELSPHACALLKIIPAQHQ
jgi:hypothetical protein